MNAIIILAAGSSSRLGSPKQNLHYKGATLLQIAIKNAVAVSDTVLVVLGANREVTEYSIKNQPVDILYNLHWAEGMASSVRLAIEKLQSDYLQVTAAIVMLCDQPFANAELLEKLINTNASSDIGITASSYNNIIGVPVIFKQKYFPYLTALKGNEGAKQLLQQHADDVNTVDFPLGSIDIDTMEDWQKYCFEA